VDRAGDVSVRDIEVRIPDEGRASGSCMKDQFETRESVR